MWQTYSQKTVETRSEMGYMTEGKIILLAASPLPTHFHESQPLLPFPFDLASDHSRGVHRHVNATSTRREQFPSIRQQNQGPFWRLSTPTQVDGLAMHEDGATSRGCRTVTVVEEGGREGQTPPLPALDGNIYTVLNVETSIFWGGGRHTLPSCRNFEGFHIFVQFLFFNFLFFSFVFHIFVF